MDEWSISLWFLPLHQGGHLTSVSYQRITMVKLSEVDKGRALGQIKPDATLQDDKCSSTQSKELNTASSKLDLSGLTGNLKNLQGTGILNSGTSAETERF